MLFSFPRERRMYAFQYCGLGFFFNNRSMWLQTLTETTDHLNPGIIIWVVRQEEWVALFNFIFSKQIYGKNDVHILYHQMTNYKIEVLWTCTWSSLHKPWAGSPEQTVLLFFTTVISEKLKSSRTALKPSLLFSRSIIISMTLLVNIIWPNLMLKVPYWPWDQLVKEYIYHLFCAKVLLTHFYL